MKILSIYPGHNASICILEDDKVLINWELERFSRIKHDYGYSEDFLFQTLHLMSLTINDLDFICINRGLIDNSIVRKGTVYRPFEVPPTTDKMVIPFTVKFHGKKFDALAINHHLAHASCAFFTSPFTESAVFTYDGYGDAESSSIGFAEGNKIGVLERGHLLDLAGWWASIPLNNYRMPRVHELDPGSHAGKIMALAAYGKEDYEIMPILEQDMDKAFRCSHYPDPGAYAFNNAEDLSDTHQLRSKNLAYALQSKTENTVLYYFNAVAKQYSNTQNICYAGGLALNCIANSNALFNSPFRNLHVPPCPNDAGIALGMAFYAYYHYFNNPRTARYFMPYTGPNYFDSKEIFARLAKEKEYEIEIMDRDKLVDIFCNREIVCFFINRSECGPRALGNRSIMCLPDRKNCRDFLNLAVKKREWFRPFGPVILADFVNEILDNCPDSPYMNMVAHIRQEWITQLKGVNHINNTTRPQILKLEHNPFLYEVLFEIYKHTGIPALLNTSFNLKEPIVETPLNAWETFQKLPINYLVTDDFIIQKQ